MSSSDVSEVAVAEKIEQWLNAPDSDGWAWWYTYLTPIVNLNLRRFEDTIDSHDLEDLTQVVVQKILSRLHQFDREKATLKTWVKIVTHNSARDHLRKRRPIYIDSQETDLEAGASQMLLSPEDIMEMHGWIPYRIEHRALQRIADVFVKHRGRVTRTVVVEVSTALAFFKVDYHGWASATQVTHFLFALIRLVKARDTDRDRVRRALRGYKDTTPLGLVIKRCGVEVAIELLVLFGGGEVALPDIATVVSVRSQAGRR